LGVIDMHGSVQNNTRVVKTANFSMEEFVGIRLNYKILLAGSSLAGRQTCCCD
jgi:hypothetical protein